MWWLKGLKDGRFARMRCVDDLKDVGKTSKAILCNELQIPILKHIGTYKKVIGQRILNFWVES